MRIRLVVLLTALCMPPAACIPLDQFIGYPFEDVATFPSVDDDFLSVDLAIPFALGATEYGSVHINNNGLLSFVDATSAYTPTPFPTEGQAYVSPFWADVDTRMADGPQCDNITNAVYLKEYVRGTEGNEAILQSIGAIVVNSSEYEMNGQFCPGAADATYELQWAYVVSWIQVGYYSTNCDKHNSFQAILTTNGVQSFAIFNYGEIQWVTGDASGGSNGFGGTAALVGINAADGSYTVHPNSLTDNISNIDTEPGNVNSVLGQWVYRTDASSSNTNTGTGVVPLTLAPLTGHVLGGTPIYSYGRCLQDLETIDCSFGGEVVEGEDLLNGQVLCISPEMATFGRVPVTLQIRLGDYTLRKEEVTFYAVSPDVAFGVTYAGVDLQRDGHTLRVGDTVEIRWSTDILPHREDTSYQVDILLYTQDVNSGFLSSPTTLARGQDNSGYALVTIPSTMDWPEDDVIVPVFLKVAEANPEGTAAVRAGKWAPVAFLVTQSEELNGSECSRWASSDPIEQQHLQDVVCCPLTVQGARWRTSGLTEVTGINRDLQVYYNPMAETCFRQTAARPMTTAGQQCCYKTDGSLLTGPSSGGTVDSHVPVDMETFWNHQIHDVAPNILCCKKSAQCLTYFARRPSDEGCVVRPPACVYGDPHVVTLDGHKYTFNGKGEYTLVATQDDSFTLQGRMVDAPSSNGSTTSRGTVFSALAAKQNESDTVQFHLTDTGLASLVNGVEFTFDEVEEEVFSNVIVSKEANGSFSATFTIGVYLEVRLANNSNSGPYISAVIVSLPERFSGQTIGLMGNYNGDASDDLVPRFGGEPLPLNASLETLHWDFGVTWIIAGASDSLFFYDSSSFVNFYDPDFTPVFEVVFDDPSLQALADELCQGDTYCLFDIAATGDPAIGLTTLIGVQELDEMVEASLPVVCSPPCANGACVANDTCSCSEGYTGERCRDAITLPCASNVCGIGGRCSVLASTLSCACRRGYSGQFCETGPTLTGLTPDAETSYESVARGDLERLLGAWGAADVALVDFSFQRLSEAEGYSFVVDSGSRLYRLDIRPGSTPYTMGLMVTQY